MEDWSAILQGNVRTLEQLEACCRIDPAERERLQRALDRHPMSVTPYYLSLIDWTDPQDPIRRMAVPSSDELSPLGSYDPSREMANTKLPGLQHKYAQTALILTTNRCAVYCRHCFRKRLVGLPTKEILERFDDAVRYIREHPGINNVLLSGGDPFALTTSTIATFLRRLSPIEHLDFIRFGTRVPVVFPRRILEDEELTGLLSKYSWADRRIYVVTQFNHPREITSHSMAAVDALIRAGVVLNNQAVLLKGVNDDPSILAELQNRLVGIGVNPYYLFQCRPVKRVKGIFQVPLARGYGIVEEAKGRINGHGKRFKYVMSHASGKIEVVGIEHGDIYFRYHQAKDPADNGRFFKRKLIPGAGWLDDLGEERDQPPTGEPAGLIVS